MQDCVLLEGGTDCVPEDATDCVPEDATDCVPEDITDVLEDITDALEDITDCAPGEWTEVDIDKVADKVSTLGWIVPPCGVTVIIVCFCFLFDTDFGFDFSFDLSFVSSKCMVNSNISLIYIMCGRLTHGQKHFMISYRESSY